MFTLQVNEKIFLRILSGRDANALFELTDQSRNHLKKWLPWLDDIKSTDDSFTFIKNSLEIYNHQKGLNMGVFFEEKLVGVIGFNKLDFRNKIGSIGYWIGEPYQGQGIMTMAVSTLITHGFEKMKLNRIDIHAAKDNLPSRKIPERLGFQQEGQLRESEWLYDHYVDHIVYGLLRSEWKMSHPQDTGKKEVMHKDTNNP